MLHFIDISNWQAGIDLRTVLANVDACVCKATEGTNYVDRCCDRFVQTCIAEGKPWGFYHFARHNSATEEADFFHKNCLNYFGHGIPVLDWEDNQSVDWVNEFVRRIHDLTGVWPWIYSTPSYFNKGGVEANCMRWVASWPSVQHPTFSQAEGWSRPSADGLVGAWQFCSDGRLDGYNANLDCDLFYGDEKAWSAYAGATPSGAETDSKESGVTLEGEGYRVTIERT